MVNHKIFPKLRRNLILLVISLAAFISLGCILSDLVTLLFKGYTEDQESAWYKMLADDESVAGDDQNDSDSSGVYGSAGDDTTSAESSGQDSDQGAEYGELKPVGFVNYGEFDATVRAYSFIPLGKTVAAPPPAPSTVSSANIGSGEWPNTSRFLSVPMGTYSWCIDWEEGDIDDDGQLDYFHYIQNDPTILDENDSDDLNLAEEVAISAPPLSGAVYEGKCKANLVDSQCVEFNTDVNVHSLYAMDQDNPPEIKVAANAAEQTPPAGIDISAGGVSTGYGSGMILWQEGDWVEISTKDPYQAMGVQVHGDQTIGWARVMFDGQEIWRGDTSSYTIAEGRYGVYIEVRCFPPGKHTLRIEGLGKDGSGGGRSIPVSYFGIRE